MEKTKKCITCGENKVLSAFYKHPKMSDGHLNKCTSCCKSQSADRYKKLSEKIEFVLSERLRTRERYHRLNYKEKQLQSPEKKAKSISVYYEKYPEKKIALNMSSHVNAPEGMQKHHWSYKKEHAKDIIFLPAKNHARLHCYIIYDQERMMYRAAMPLGSFIQNELLDTKQKHEEFYRALISNGIINE